ncbi:MAG: DUF2312 domain-containing protein [Sphingomonadales bacterium]|jgi:uncharacterized protein (UPF0335 family)
MVNVGGIAGETLRKFIERVERLDEDKKAVTEDIKEVYAEAKSLGFDPKVMRKVVTIRKLDMDARQEQEALLEIYMHALEGADNPAVDE